jgi:4-hydroxy-tetrahydrodipicolinate synthase
MVSEIDLRGVFVPLVTPFTDSGEVAYDEVEKLAVESLDAGAAGITALGTTGEPPTLEAEEKATIIRIIGDVCRAREAHFMVGAGSNSTKASVAAVEEAAAAGAQSILSVVPYYTRPTETGIVEHFKALAAASPVPIVLYNVPLRTGRGLGAASLLELSMMPNICAVKQAVGSVDVDSSILLAEHPDGFNVLCGDDAFMFPLLAMGATGAITAPSNVLAEGYVAMVDAALKGEWQMARQLHEIMLPVSQVLFAEPNPAVFKAVLHAQGRISSPMLRAPMTIATAAITESAVRIVAKAQAALRG